METKQSHYYNVHMLHSTETCQRICLHAHTQFHSINLPSNKVEYACVFQRKTTHSAYRVFARKHIIIIRSVNINCGNEKKTVGGFLVYGNCA